MKILNEKEYHEEIRLEKEKKLENMSRIASYFYRSLYQSKEMISSEVIIFYKKKKQEIVRIKTKNGRFRKKHTRWPCHWRNC